MNFISISREDDVDGGAGTSLSYPLILGNAL